MDDHDHEEVYRERDLSLKVELKLNCEIGRLRMEVIGLRREVKELKEEKEKAERQCALCRQKLFEQVALRGVCPSLDTSEQRTRHKEENEYMTTLEHEMERDEDRQKRAMSYSSELVELRAVYTELKEEYESDKENHRQQLSSIAKDQKIERKGWEALQTNWQLEKANLDGEIRDIKKELQEIDKTIPPSPPSTHHSSDTPKKSWTWNRPAVTSTYATPSSNGVKDTVKIQTENVINKEFGKLQRALITAQDDLKRELAHRGQLQKHYAEQQKRKRSYSGRYVDVMETIHSDPNSLTHET